MQADAWLSDEERLGAVARRVFARARRRPRWPVAAALAVTAAFVAHRASRAPVYEAALHFRLDEGEVGDARAVPLPPPRDIREYIAAFALTREHLTQVLRAHHVSERRLALDPVGAIDDFRENVDIVVTRNYFLVDREPEDEPRTAYVTVTLQGNDPEKVRAMLHDIGEQILATQREERVDRLAEARGVFAGELARARAATQALQRELGQARQRAAGAGAAAIAAGARAAALEAQTLDAIEREVAIERRASAVAFNADAEGQRLAMSLDLFDEGVRSVSPPLGVLGLAARTLIVFPLVLVLAAAVMGAFDDRIYGAEDLALRRVAVLAELPAFPGDDAGALAPGAFRWSQGVES